MIQYTDPNSPQQNGPDSGTAPAAPAPSALQAPQPEPPRGLVVWHAFNAPTGGQHLPDEDWAGLVARLTSEPMAVQHKEALPLWSPATFTADHRSNANVQRVNFLVWDLDGMTAEQFRTLQARLDAQRLRYVVHATPSHGIKLDLRLRLVIALSRSVPGVEWPAFWEAARLFLELPESADKNCRDACRQFYVPGRVPGTLYGVCVCDGSERVPLDVDLVLAQPSPQALIQASFQTGADPIPREAIENLGKKLRGSKGTDPKPLRVGTFIKTGLDGHALTEGKGNRHEVLRDLAWELAKAWPTGSPASLASHFRLSLDFMREGAAQDPVKHFEDLIASGQRKTQAEQAKRAAERAADRRPIVRLGAEQAGQLTAMADVSIAALASLDVFQRSGVLCHVTRDATADKVVRPDGAPTIRDLPFATLRELLDQVVRFEVVQDGTPKAVHPPQDVVIAVAQRGQWSHIRPLRGTASYPILRPDGSLLAKPGYDTATATLSSCVLPITVPENPSRGDAERALAALLELVADFPFADDAARSVWLAALFAPLVRAAIEGPVPLTILDANARGSGKTLLASLVGRIVLGAELPMRTAPETQEEWRKALFAMVQAGDPLVLIDNVTRMVQSAALDSILTGTTYTDRVLGVSQERTLPIRTTFMLSSNNARLSTDLVRRSLHCRLDSKTEQPEHRHGFRFPRILAHAGEHRAYYLSAALTVLRAYVVAGRPAVPCRTLGSFESWSEWVAAPLVWLGLPDPSSTQDMLREVADVERDDVGALLRAWHATFPNEAPQTARAVLGAAAFSPGGSGESAELRDALSAVCGSDPDKLPASRALGNKLRTLRDQIVSGLVLRRQGEARSGFMWAVQRLAP